MKRRDPQERYEAWLEAEARDDERTSDAALAMLFAELPLEAPSAGFAAATLARFRVEARAERQAAVAAETAPAVGAARWAAVFLALLSAGTLGLSAFAVTILPRLELGAAVAVFNSVVAASWEWIASGITLWVRLAEWSDLVARVVAVPGVAWTLFGAAAGAAFAFSLLRRILMHDLHEKESIHVRHH